MTTIQTPLRVEILMHCRCRRVDPIPHIGAPVVKEEVASLMSIGAIQLVDGYYATTPLGDAWVTAILNAPLPRMCFVDQHGKEIL